jgi:protocatechuate 3,4-dioxygenase beta subunit
MPVTADPRKRRLAIAAIGVLFLPLLSRPRATAQPAAALSPTPADLEGPFYPVRLPADRDFDLTIVQGRTRAAQGTRLYLSGRVLDTSGRALAGARIELWQCDATGHYHHVDGDRPGDPDFQGYGVATTDDTGRYRFKTIRPVAYGGRPPHLHVKIAHADASPLTTQLYVRGDDDAADPVAQATGRRTRERLLLALSPRAEAEPGALQAEYAFVLLARSPASGR